MWYKQSDIPKCTQQKTSMALVFLLETAQPNYSQDHTAKEFSYFTAARKMPTKKKCQKLRCWRFKVRKGLGTLERTV